jgi:hypothetical protein
MSPRLAKVAARAAIAEMSKPRKYRQARKVRIVSMPPVEEKVESNDVPQVQAPQVEAPPVEAKHMDEMAELKETIARLVEKYPDYESEGNKTIRKVLRRGIKDILSKLPQEDRVRRHMRILWGDAQNLRMAISLNGAVLQENGSYMVNGKECFYDSSSGKFYNNQGWSETLWEVEKGRIGC